MSGFGRVGRTGLPWLQRSLEIFLGANQSKLVRVFIREAVVVIELSLVQAVCTGSVIKNLAAPGVLFVLLRDDEQRRKDKRHLAALVVRPTQDGIAGYGGNGRADLAQADFSG